MTSPSSTDTEESAFAEGFGGTGLRMRIQSAAVFVIAMVPVMAAAQQFLPAQGPPVDPNARFEVAAVKAAGASGQMLLSMTPGRFESTGVPVRILLRRALQKPDYQIVGAPGWIDTERYSIAAKVPDGLPPSAIPVMLQNLLKDRFQLATHLENREQAIFNLVIARTDGRLGPDLKASSAECQATIAAKRAAPPPGAAGPGGPPPLPPFDPFDPNGLLPCGFWRRGLNIAAGVGRSIADLIPMLSDITGRPVIDKTGLTGLYDYTLKFAPEPGGAAGPFGPPPPGAPVPAIDPDTPNLYTAAQEQLGMKLEAPAGRWRSWSSTSSRSQRSTKRTEGRLADPAATAVTSADVSTRPRPDAQRADGQETDSQLMQLTPTEARRIAVALLQAAEKVESEATRSR